MLQNRRAFAEAQELSAQLRSLSWHALNLQEDVQRSVSRELHDDFGQIVTAIGTLLGRARRHLADNAPLAAELESVRGVAQHALDRIRAQSQWFHPGVLDDYGLEKALERAVEQFQQQSGIETALTVTGSLDAVRPEFAIHIYRIVQEELNNIERHLGSAHADVRLTCANGSLDVDIADRGTGLLADAPRGLGFVTMRERAELMGGRLRVGEAAGGGGVAVHVTVPRIAEAVEIAGAPA